VELCHQAPLSQIDVEVPEEINQASYGAAMKVIGNAAKQETGRWLNYRAENWHVLFRRREWAMLRFWRMRSLQKFAAVYSFVHNHFNQERHIYQRQNFKWNRIAAFSEWRQLFSA
jgi:putative transposase